MNIFISVVVVAQAVGSMKSERLERNEQNYYYFNTFLNADAAVSETGINDFISEQPSC